MKINEDSEVDEGSGDRKLPQTSVRASLKHGNPLAGEEGKYQTIQQRTNKISAKSTLNVKANPNQIYKSGRLNEQSGAATVDGDRGLAAEIGQALNENSIMTYDLLGSVNNVN